MKTIRALIISLVVLVLGTAHAQDDQDDQALQALFQRAAAAEREKRWDAAIDAYEEAFTLSGVPRILFLIGKACAEGGVRRKRGIEALDTYVKVLSDINCRPGEHHVDAQRLRDRLLHPPPPDRPDKAERLPRPLWRLLSGAAAAAAGAGLLGYGAWAWSENGRCPGPAQTLCPKVYDSLGIGVGLSLTGAVLIAGGVVLIALPGKRNH